MSAEVEARIFESMQRDYIALNDELGDAHSIIVDLRDELTDAQAEADALSERIDELNDELLRASTNAFDDYQEFTATTTIYPRATQTEALTYLALGLTSEAGEVAGKLKKVLRDKGGVTDYADRIEINKEVGDILWYAARILDEMGYSLGYAARANRDKLESRAKRGVLGGSGDNR